MAARCRPRLTKVKYLVLLQYADRFDTPMCRQSINIEDKEKIVGQKIDHRWRYCHICACLCSEEKTSMGLIEKLLGSNENLPQIFDLCSACAAVAKVLHRRCFFSLHIASRWWMRCFLYKRHRLLSLHPNKEGTLSSKWHIDHIERKKLHQAISGATGTSRQAAQSQERNQQVKKLTTGGATVCHICSCLFSEENISKDQRYLKIFFFSFLRRVTGH